MKNEPSIIEVEQTKEAIEEFWTQERISASQPIEMPTYPPLEAPIRTQPEPTYEKANADESPAGACGAFHVISKELGLMTGSACAIAPRIVLTAAHCMYDRKNKEWYSNPVFLPRYRGNVFPWNYPIKWICYWRPYIENPGITWDFVMCITHDDMTPQIGYLDANVNYDFRLNSPVAMFGYPSGLDGGNIMYRDNGYVNAPTPSYFANLSALAKLQSCGAQGVSGGPWLDATNRVVGLNSESDCARTVRSPKFFEGGRYQWLLDLAKRRVNEA